VIRRLGPPVQIAYAVPDAEVFARRWATSTGAGPFFLRRHIAVVDVTYRGRPAAFDHTSAYGQWGSIMLELVHVHTPGPNVVTDVIGDSPTGLHHLAFLVADLDAATEHLDEHGHPLAMTAHTGNGTEFRFVDASRALGHMIELYVDSDRLRAFYAEVADAALGWDGTDPVREL
jgi:catechol 2,3-dioxygenase-like lactoylglutathione lyase family enzyme